jgi:small subunit ribosomal protein S16
MVTIRLSRGGTLKRPFYHIVATDHRSRRDGRYLERLGFFNPIAAGKDARLQVDRGRVEYWISQGAQLSARVADLLDEEKTAPAGATAA